MAGHIAFRLCASLHDFTLRTARIGCSFSPEIPEALLEEVVLSSTTLGPTWGCDRPRLQFDCMLCQNIFGGRPVVITTPCMSRLQGPLSEACMHLAFLLHRCGLPRRRLVLSVPCIHSEATAFFSHGCLLRTERRSQVCIAVGMVAPIALLLAAQRCTAETDVSAP